MESDDMLEEDREFIRSIKAKVGGFLLMIGLYLGFCVILRYTIGSFIGAMLDQVTKMKIREDEALAAARTVPVEIAQLVESVNRLRSVIGDAVEHDFDGYEHCDAEGTGEGCRRVQNPGVPSGEFDKERLQEKHKMDVLGMVDRPDIKQDCDTLMLVSNLISSISLQTGTAATKAMLYRINTEMKRLKNYDIQLNPRFEQRKMIFDVVLGYRTYLLTMVDNLDGFPVVGMVGRINQPNLQNRLAIFRSRSLPVGFYVDEEEGIPIVSDGKRMFTLAETRVIARDIIKGSLQVYLLNSCSDMNYLESIRGMVSRETGLIERGVLANLGSYFAHASKEENLRCFRKQLFEFLGLMRRIWEKYTKDLEGKPLRSFVASNGLAAIKSRLDDVAVHFYFTAQKLIGKADSRFPEVIYTILEHPFISGAPFDEQYKKLMSMVSYFAEI